MHAVARKYAGLGHAFGILYAHEVLPSDPGSVQAGRMIDVPMV